MRDQTEFLAEIYDRYEKNKRIRNRKYIKTAASFCLFVILGTAALPLLTPMNKSSESENFTNKAEMPTSSNPIITPTSQSQNGIYGSNSLGSSLETHFESMDFGTKEKTEESITTTEYDTKDIAPYCIEFATTPPKEFIYPFCAEEISAVTLRNGKGKTYTITSEKNIDLFYDYFCLYGVHFVPASQEIRDTNETYTVEFQCHIGKSKIFYIRGKETNVLSLMKALQENE